MPSAPRTCDPQLNQLSEATDRAAENPARFNLTMEEVQSRRRWLDTTFRQVGAHSQWPLGRGNLQGPARRESLEMGIR